MGNPLLKKNSWIVTGGAGFIGSNLISIYCKIIRYIIDNFTQVT